MSLGDFLAGVREILLMALVAELIRRRMVPMVMVFEPQNHVVDINMGEINRDSAIKIGVCRRCQNMVLHSKMTWFHLYLIKPRMKCENKSKHGFTISFARSCLVLGYKTKAKCTFTISFLLYYRSYLVRIF